MAMNMYKIKKWGAGFFMAFMPTVTFLVMIIATGDLLQAIMGFLIMAPFSIFIGFRILKNPFTDLLEGSGLLTITLDSTGTLNPFIVKLVPPFLEGRVQGKKVSTIFNRDSVPYMATPIKTTASLTEDGDIEILTMKIPKDKKTSYLFGLNQYPVLIYNKNLQEFISKDAFMKFESDTFVKHLVLYLNRKVEDLTSQLRDFARYIVEQTRPRPSMFGPGWLKWVIIIGAIILLFIILAPYVLNAMLNIAGQAAETTGDIITPR